MKRTGAGGDEPSSAARTAREVRLLLQAARALHRTLNRETILRSLVRTGMKLTGATAGVAGVMDGDRMLFTEYHRGRTVEPVNLAFARGEFVPGRVMRTRKAYLSNDAIHDPIVNQKLRRTLGFRNLLNTPIQTRGGRLLGCFELHNTADGRPFDANDVRLLEGLAEMAAVALGNAEVLAERTRTRSALEVAHRESEGLFQGIRQPALILNGECNVLAANRAMVRIAGGRRSLVGLHCREVYRGSTESCPSCPVSPRSNGRKRDGVLVERTVGRRSLLVSCTSIRGARGRVERIFQVGTDITDRKRIEQELLQEHGRAQSYLQIAAVMIVAIDPKQRVTLVNRRACELLGSTEEEILGRNWFDRFVPKRERERVRTAFTAILRGEQEPIEYFENPVRTRSGRERLIAWHNTTLRDAEGRVVGTLSSGTDVTESRRAETELRALNENLEARVAERTRVAEERARQLRYLARELTEAELRERRRIAQLLHEHFQQQLAAARVHLGLLARQPLGDRQQATVQTVDDILKESIHDSRSLAVSLCPPVLYELGLAPALDWLAGRMLEWHGLHVRVENLSGREPGDANLRAFLFESVRELLFNVVKHARAEHATVSMHRDDGDVLRIVVADAGIGFHPEATSPIAPGGEGFGLFSIRERLASLGGWSEVESRRGRGTRVTLCAPMGE